MLLDFRRVRFLLFALLVAWQPLQAQVCSCRASEPAGPTCCCCAAEPAVEETSRHGIRPENHGPAGDCRACIDSPARTEPRHQAGPRPLLLLPPAAAALPVLAPAPTRLLRPVLRPPRPPCAVVQGPRSPPLV